MHETMRKSISRLVLAAPLALVGCANWDSVERDLSKVAIVEPAEAKGSSTLAVEELKFHLGKVCSSQFVEAAPMKFIFARPADGREPAPFESIYRIDGDSVYFWGDDSGMVMTWKLGDKPFQQDKIRNGSLFAVELFVENELGVKWIWPGDDGYLFTPRSRVRLPRRKEASYVSRLDKAEFRAGGKARKCPSYKECSKFVPGLPEEILSFDPKLDERNYLDRLIWRCRMRLQDRTHFGYGHAFTDWKTRFGKTHPEYLALVDGERGNVKGERDAFVHLCVSNEGTVNQIIADWLRRGTNRYLNVCENDGTAYCQCPGCVKFDVNLPSDGKLIHRSDRYVQFWDRIAEKAIAIRPDVVLVAYLYNEYRHEYAREYCLYIIVKIRVDGVARSIAHVGVEKHADKQRQSRGQQSFDCLSSEVRLKRIAVVTAGIHRQQYHQHKRDGHSNDRREQQVFCQHKHGAEYYKLCRVP